MSSTLWKTWLVRFALLPMAIAKPIPQGLSFKPPGFPSASKSAAAGSASGLLSPSNGAQNGAVTEIPFPYPSGLDIGPPSTYTFIGAAGGATTTLERVESLALTDANGLPTATIAVSDLVIQAGPTFAEVLVAPDGSFVEDICVVGSDGVAECEEFDGFGASTTATETFAATFATLTVAAVPSAPVSAIKSGESGPIGAQTTIEAPFLYPEGGVLGSPTVFNVYGTGGAQTTFDRSEPVTLTNAQGQATATVLVEDIWILGNGQLVEGDFADDGSFAIVACELTGDTGDCIEYDGADTTLTTATEVFTITFTPTTVAAVLATLSA